MTDNRPGSALTPAERLERRNRNEAYADQIQEMFTRGESFGAISRATGVPKATVQHMCKRLAAEYVRERYGDPTAMLGRELNILDALTSRNLPKAVKGDKAAADIVLASHVRRSRLLGLDAAVKAEITVRTAQDIEIERLVAMLGQNGSESSQEPLGSLGDVAGPGSSGDANVGGMPGGSA